MTVSPARRSFHLRLSAAVSYEQAVEVCIETRRAGEVTDKEILDDQVAWAQLRAEEIKVIGAAS